MNIEQIGAAPTFSSSAHGSVGFGRIVSVDHRDKKFLLRARLNMSAIATGPRYRYWHTGPVLDQGSTPQCVAYAGGQFLQSGPVVNAVMRPVTNYLEALYYQCQMVDEWPDDEPYEGTSVRALFKVLKTRGFVTRYEWAFQAIEMAAWVQNEGPLVVGTDWHEGMMGDSAHARRTGFISPTGFSLGGHAWFIKGVNLSKLCPDGTIGAFRMLNSWGRSWMEHGCAWISFRDMQKLLDNYGECATAAEIKFEETDEE